MKFKTRAEIAVGDAVKIVTDKDGNPTIEPALDKEESSMIECIYWLIVAAAVGFLGGMLTAWIITAF